jgi:hypothetical protein
MLLGDPSSALVAQRGEEEGIGPTTVSAKVRNALSFLRPLATEGLIEVRLHDTTLYNSIYRFDTHMLVNGHVWGANAYGSPVLHLRQVQGGSLFGGYAKSLDAVWAAARPVEQATAAS